MWSSGYITLERLKAWELNNFFEGIVINPILCGDQIMEPYSRIERTNEQYIEIKVFLSLRST